MSGKEPDDHLTFRKKYTREKDDVIMKEIKSIWNSYVTLPWIGFLIIFFSGLFFRFNFFLVEFVEKFAFKVSNSLEENIKLICVWFFIVGSILLIKGIYNLLNEFLE